MEPREANFRTIQPVLTRDRSRPLTRTASVIGILLRREFFIKPCFVQHISMPSFDEIRFLVDSQYQHGDVSAETEWSENVSHWLGLL